MNPNSSDTIPEKLSDWVAARVRERSNRRVRNLAVQRVNGALVVRGQAKSYYAWQLAIAAGHELALRLGSLKLDCRLEIETSSSLAPRTYDTF